MKMIFEILFLLFALQIEKCSAQVDKPVSLWTECSVTCGEGTRTKKTCFGGDSMCKEKKEDCNIQVCRDTTTNAPITTDSTTTPKETTTTDTTTSLSTTTDTTTNAPITTDSTTTPKETTTTDTTTSLSTTTAPCQCNLIISDLKLCMALHKDDISIHFNGTCYPEKLFNAIKFLKEKYDILTFQDKEFEICQTKLKKYLPKFIFEYNKCCKNINFYLRKWKSALQLKINKLSNEYDEYDQLLFKLTDMVLFEMAQEIKIEKDYLITTLPTLGNTYSISFELMIRELPLHPYFASIISMSGMNNKKEEEFFLLFIDNNDDEIKLGITVEPSSHGFSDLTINETFMNKWLNISISKVKIDGKFTSTVKVNKETWIDFVGDEKHYSDIKVFATNIFPDESNNILLSGSIKNIKIENLDLMEKTGTN